MVNPPKIMALEQPFEENVLRTFFPRIGIKFGKNGKKEGNHNLS